MLTFEEIYERLEAIGDGNHARIMRDSVSRHPDYSLQFANELLAEKERKHLIKINKNESLSVIEHDPQYISGPQHLQEKVNFVGIRIKNKISEVFTEEEIKSFLDYWNGMVEEANSKRMYFCEWWKNQDSSEFYCYIKLALLARDRSRRLNNWKRYRSEYHQDAENRFKAFVIDRSPAEYIEARRKRGQEIQERRRNVKANILKEKVKNYYYRKIPLFADVLLNEREKEFPFSYGINSFKKITF